MKGVVLIPLLIMLLGCDASYPSTQSRPSVTDSDAIPDSTKQSATKELMGTPWVKDVYFSPGYANIGVIRGEKNWDSPMIGRFIASILAKHNIRVQRIRFVDIQQVVYQKKSPRDAEIAVYAP